MSTEISPLILEKAPLILAEIKKATSVLLHCHPSPDPDSVGSSLAMKFALEQMGKKVTLIRGDSIIPQAFMHFPGAKDIQEKSYLDIDPTLFDLFIILDTADTGRVSSKGKVEFPATMRTVNIDHHSSNPDFAEINLVETMYPATAQILFDLFHEWKVKITKEIAENLFIGIYTDTGGFKFRGATVRTFTIAAELVRSAPDFGKLIIDMQNSNTPEFITFQALALNSIETFYGQKLVISAVSYDDLIKKNIPPTETSSSAVSPILNTVIGWDINVALVEVAPGKVKCSLRTRDQDAYDVSKLASALGGGGHKAAAGATMMMPLPEAKKCVVQKAKDLYNL